MQAKNVQIVPAWSVTVVNQAGEPVAGLKVAEDREFYGLPSRHRGFDSRVTDGKGMVVFPEQSFMASEAELAEGRGLSALNVHASFGPSGSVRISPSGCKDVQVYYATDGKIYDRSGSKPQRRKGDSRPCSGCCRSNVFDSIYKQDWATVKRMLAADAATARARDSQGGTPLMLLSDGDFSGPKAELIKLLLEAGPISMPRTARRRCTTPPRITMSPAWNSSFPRAPIPR